MTVADHEAASRGRGIVLHTLTRDDHFAQDFRQPPAVGERPEPTRQILRHPHRATVV
ncbi:MAG: hypothetical protein OXH75_21315 [Acidobacteria bacterium]|nr:hypothetical protein [Acidobacteriota bacterium]